MTAGPRRALEVLRTDGPAAVWWRLLERTGYRRLVFLARPVGTRPPSSEPAAGLEFSLLTPTEVGEYDRLRPDAPPAETRRRLAAGERCLLGRLEGEPVHARWFAFERVAMPYLNHSFELAPGVVYAYDGFTAPAARRLQISAAAPGFEQLFGGRAANSLLVAVWPENWAGSGLASRLGYERVGSVALVGPAHHGPLIRRGPVGGYLGTASRLPGRAIS